MTLNKTGCLLNAQNADRVNTAAGGGGLNPSSMQGRNVMRLMNLLSPVSRGAFMLAGVTLFTQAARCQGRAAWTAAR